MKLLLWLYVALVVCVGAGVLEYRRAQERRLYVEHNQKGCYGPHCSICSGHMTIDGRWRTEKQRTRWLRTRAR